MAERDDLVELITVLSADTRRMERAFDKMRAKSQQTTRDIESRWKRTGDRINSSFGRMRSFAGGFGAGLVTGLIADLDNLAFGAIEAADAIEDLGRQTGISGKTLEEMRYALQQTGGEFESAGRGLATFRKNLAQAKIGKGPLADFMKAAKLDGADAEQALINVVKSLSLIEDEEQRLLQATRIFGPRFGASVAAMAVEFDELRQKAHETGNVMEDSFRKGLGDAADELESFKGTVATVWGEIVATVLEAGGEIVDYVNQTFPELGEAIREAGGFGEWFRESAEEAVEELKPVIDALKTVKDTIEWLNRLRKPKPLIDWSGIVPPQYLKDGMIDLNKVLPFTGPSAADIEKTKDAYNIAGATAERYRRKLIELERAKEDAFRLDPTEEATADERLDILLREQQGYDALQGAMQRAAEERRKQQGLAAPTAPDLVATASGATPATPGITAPPDLAEDEARAAEDAAEAYRNYVEALAARQEIYPATKQAIAEEIASLNNEAIMLGLTAAEADKMRAAVTLLNAAQQAGIDLTPEMIAEINGLAQAYADAAEKVREVGEAQEAAAELSALFERAFVDGVFAAIEGGEKLKDVLKDLLQSLARMALSAAFQGLFGGAGPGAGPGGFLINLLGGGASRAAPALPGVAAMAAGGEDIHLELGLERGLVTQEAERVVETRKGQIIKISVVESQKATRANFGAFARDYQMRSA